ncbi:MAG: NAD(P)/FAD-dependent oxidoreductase [Lentisphaeria bacterium]|nr:NAD(P)/FAD-dependent oxidoreductase [Lentisphaeria bacterium]
MRIAIVGGGVAAFEAATAARKQNETAEIAVYSRETVAPYRRPALSGMVAHEMEDARFFIKGEAFFRQERIALHLGAEVVKLAPAERLLTLSSGERVSYDRLILATGARPFVPPVPGLNDGQNVAVLREFADLENLRGRLDAGDCRKVTVLGGGVLGLELAAALLERGAAVTVVEAAPAIMPRNLDAEAGKLVLEHLSTRTGLELRFGASAANWDGKALKLADGTQIECDLVCVSAGVRANIQLAADAGLPCGRGIIVDDMLRVAGFDGVYAAGDAAECGGQGCGLYNTARAMGKTAGTNAAGGSATFAFEATPVRLAVMGLKIFSTGDISGTGEGGGDVTKYRKLFRDGTGKLRGAILMGDVSEALKLQAEIGHCAVTRLK